MNGKPTDDTIALAAFLLGSDWVYADDLRETLGRLGFRRPSSQWLVTRLVAMSKESAPRFERAKPFPFPHGTTRYRVTSWAATGLGNQWKGFDSWRVDRDLPTPKPEHLRAADTEREG